METPLTASELEEIGLVAIVRTPLMTDFTAIAEALANGGFRAMEITLNTPGALDAISAIRRMGIVGLRVGAGTILDSADALGAIDAGAEFIVTPTLQPETIEVCRNAAVPIYCGALTPTEALTAHRAGADFIKVFPAQTFGPGYIRAMLAPLPFLKIVPTGGVTLENMKSWFEAGCVGVAIGSALVGKQVLLDRDWDGLSHTARQFVRVHAGLRPHAHGE